MINSNNNNNSYNNNSKNKNLFVGNVSHMVKPGCQFALNDFFYKQFIFDSRPKNCLNFSKKSPPKIV